MNGTDMEEIPFQKVKTRRKRSHCPPGVPLTTIVCEDEFDCKELESLFQNYNLKLEQTSTLKALAVLIFMSSTLAVVELLSGPSLTISKGSHPVHCVIFVSLFIVTNVKYLQVTQLQQIVNLTLLFGFTFSFLCCPFSLGAMGLEPPTSPEQGMWQLILVTFVAYALLPVRTLLAVVFGIMVSISHLIVTATSVTVKTQKLWRTVCMWVVALFGDVWHQCLQYRLCTLEVEHIVTYVGPWRKSFFSTKDSSPWVFAQALIKFDKFCQDLFF